MTDEWYCEMLKNLKTKENRLSALTEIRFKLETLETVFTNRLLSSPELYDCLEDGSGNCDSNRQTELVSDILSICMSQLSISQSDLPQLLHRALQHKRSHIRALALNTILKELERDPAAAKGRVSDDLLLLILDNLQQEETEVGVPAIAILSLVLVTCIDNQQLQEALKHMLLTQNEIIKCRVYELAVNLAKHSPEVMQHVEFLLDRALSELDNDDVVLQVNILEILVSLAEQNHGLLYLEKRQVFEVISKRIDAIEQNPIDRLLVPGIMKFFGKIASIQPNKIINGYPHMIECLFDCIRSGDTSTLPPAYDTLANLTRSSSGKLLLEKQYSSTLIEIFQVLSSHLRNLSSDLKNRLFNTLEIIFTAESNNPDISELLHKWFTYLADGSNMQFLMDFCRNPFPDIKVSCLNFIKALCMFPWGIMALKDTAGFVEYLLDRKIEFDKEAKYAKFQVIQLLTESSAFDVQTHLQLRTYINEGPYYVEAAMDIAVEGN